MNKSKMHTLDISKVSRNNSQDTNHSIPKLVKYDVKNNDIDKLKMAFEILTNQEISEDLQMNNTIN